MKITVKTFATLREVFSGTGVLTIELPEKSSVEDLIEALRKQTKHKISLEDLGESNPSIKVLVNGREITYLNGIKTELKDGDVVAIIPPVGGG